VGTERFTEQEILATFELKTPRWNSWYKQNDRYSRESLQGDLEKLRSFYLDRGHADFQIESAQVSISPEKDEMFITISIQEGDVYRIADARIAGNTRVPAEELQRLLLVRKGQLYSQQQISATQQLIQNRLGFEGYAFAEVDPVPRLDKESKEVTMTFFVDPGQRVYVRHIEFEGTTRTMDYVLRRELRQLEGAWVSNVALERSKQRIQRLPFIEEVDFETRRVEGSEDLVDVAFTIKEGPSASLSGGLGYSESSSFSLNGSLTDANFFGTGRRVALELSAGNYAQVYSFSHTNPYATIDGVSRTLSASYTRQTQLTSSYSDFSTQTWLAGAQYSWPVSETQYFHLGGSVQRVELVTSDSSSYQLWHWVRDNGGYRYLRRSGGVFIRGAISDLVELTAGWSHDSRNRTLFPTSGTVQSLSLTSTVPGSGLEYASATWRYQQYFRLPLPLLDQLPLRIAATAGHGRAFGNTSALPPNRHWFVGGPDSVRGFRESTLGPRDSLGNPFGGDTALYGTAEAILPLPRKWQTSARVSVFFDFGQAFYLGKTEFRDKNGAVSDTHFDLRRLRTSAGIGVEWLAPLGLFRFSYAVPISWQRETSRLFGDQRERFQFSIGSAF
jgi:outer membrane protein insertion porin family